MSESPQSVLTIEITSFSYKRELPPLLFSSAEGRHGGGFVFDCRALPNPGRLEEFKVQTGRDEAVIAYLMATPEALVFKEHVFALVRGSVDNYLSRGFTFLSVGFGCTGGQHRSVFMTEQLSTHLRDTYPGRVVTKVYHSNLPRS